MKKVKAKTCIYIPSAGRPTRQFTLDRLAPASPYPIRLVVPESEADEYAKKYFKQREADNYSIMVCPVTGIGATRQWILETTPYRRILMFDDDMYFYHRKAPMDWHLATNEKSDNFRMLGRLVQYLKAGYVHVGMAARPEASFYLCESRIATRINNIHGFNVEKVLWLMQKGGINFKTLPVMEDFAVTLSFLTRGFQNRVLLDYVWNQPGSNSDGGCSTYRTPEVQEKAAKRLRKLFPDFVKVVTKKVRGVTSWTGMKERTDVQIQWKKAYLSSGRGEPEEWAIEQESKR